MSLLKVPAGLKTFDNWVGWNWELKKNSRGVESWTKPPYDLKSNRTLRHADTNNPATWAPFEVANAEYSGFDPRFDGVGIVLPPGMGGVDFDGVITDEKPEPYVLEILKHLGNPYCEITPSDNGLRALFYAPTLPREKGRKFHGKKPGVDKYGAEIYFGAEPGRYLTVTGNEFSGDGIPTPADIDLVHLLMSQIGNEKFKKLWMGDTSDYVNDQSAADFALIRVLARLLNKDSSRMEKYFGASILGQREKWTGRADYRERTIKAALNGSSRAAASSISIQPADLEFHLPVVTVGTNYDFVVDPAPGQTDGWFPLGAPSLLGGSSGSNKTTWMMQLLLAQTNREPFLNHTTTGRPYLILMADRGEASHQRTMRRMRMETENIPIKFLAPQMGLAALQEIVNGIEETNPLPEIVFIEGCDMLVEDANKKQIVGPFMGALQRIATHFHLAIVGSVGAPKCKAGEGYIAKRDNISGTEAWSRLAETVVLLQYPKGKDTVSERELTVLPRNAPSESFSMVMKRGRLELQTEEERERAEGLEQELQWVREQARLAKNDPTKTWWTILDMQRALGLPKTTAYRWAEAACAKGYITEKPGKKGRSKAARFRWNESKTNLLWTEHHEENDQSEMEL
jgi:hypothetical protein